MICAACETAKLSPANDVSLEEGICGVPQVTDEVLLDLRRNAVVAVMDAMSYPCHLGRELGFVKRKIIAHDQPDQNEYRHDAPCACGLGQDGGDRVIRV